MSELNAKLRSFVTLKTTSTDVRGVSIYFRDLTSGHWTGINEDEKYTPASMLKVATLIAFLKKGRNETDFLKKQIRYTDAIDETSDQYFLPKNKIVKGKTYTVLELLHAMIVESDNNARRLLHGAIDKNDIKKVYDDLGIFIPGSSASEDFMSAKTYSYFLRLLYNASYVGRISSESALNMLTQTSFDGGLHAGVPQDITVAHKFGERELINEKNKTSEHEFHDCGIVYAPEKPYLLCVMTRGSSYKNLNDVVTQASALVYQSYTQ